MRGTALAVPAATATTSTTRANRATRSFRGTSTNLLSPRERERRDISTVTTCRERHVKRATGATSDDRGPGRPRRIAGPAGRELALRAVDQVTLKTPFMPPAAWPGTVHMYS